MGLERGKVRPASDDYALYGDLDERGKLLPCPGCGEAPDHRPDDQTCVRRRAEAVRRERKAREEVHAALAKLRDAEESAERRRLRELMVD